MFKSHLVSTEESGLDKKEYIHILASSLDMEGSLSNVEPSSSLESLSDLELINE